MDRCLLQLLLLLLMLPPLMAALGEPAPAPGSKSPLNSIELPRYVMCSKVSTSSVVWPGGATLRAFAASVTSGDAAPGRRKGRLTLRVALLLDDGKWEVVLPTFENKDKRSEELASLGHAKNVSYAKCVNSGLPRGLEASCRLASGYNRQPTPGNMSWHAGQMFRFRNSEVAQDFAECQLTAFEHLWISRQHAPRRLLVDLRLSENGPEPKEKAVVPLELCQVERPVVRASFCSQPLYGFRSLQAELPWAVEDWLEYHLGHVGFAHADIYDIDGSFQEAIEPWTSSASWRQSSLSYIGSWPSRLSPALEAYTKQYPYCTEAFAYAHCLTTSRAYSRWTALLHAPDEYLVLPTARHRPGWLVPVLDTQESEQLEGYVVGSFRVFGVSFARGGKASEEGRSVDAGRGSVLQASMLRSNHVYNHVPFLNPMNCYCAGAHSCFAEEGELTSTVSLEISPRIMQVHHYVEMNERNRGRCSSLLKPCDVPDSSLQWAAKMLRRA